MESPKEYTRTQHTHTNLLELIIWFSKVAGYKISLYNRNNLYFCILEMNSEKGNEEKSFIYNNTDKLDFIKGKKLVFQRYAVKKVKRLTEERENICRSFLIRI